MNAEKAARRKQREHGMRSWVQVPAHVSTPFNVSNTAQTVIKAVKQQTERYSRSEDYRDTTMTESRRICGKDMREVMISHLFRMQDLAQAFEHGKQAFCCAAEQLGVSEEQQHNRLYYAAYSSSIPTLSVLINAEWYP